MLSIEVNVKVLKEAVEKAISVMNKKANVTVLERLVIETASDNMLQIMATDMTQYITIYIEDVEILQQGKIIMNKDDIKLITKLSGSIKITDTENSKITVMTEKKKLSMPNYSNENEYGEYPYTPEDNNKKLVARINESWLLKTLIDLLPFTDDKNRINNDIMKCYNFNLKERRIEALDGHKIGIKSLDNQDIIDTSIDKTCVLLNNSIPTIKKVLNKNSDKLLDIYDSLEYISIENEKFKYKIKKPNGKYLEISRMLVDNFNYKFTCDRDELLEVANYSSDLTNKEKNPMVLTYTNNDMYAYTMTKRCENADKISIDNVTIDDNFAIAINPNYVSNALKVIDTDTPLVTMISAKTPINIYGKEYRFLILPVNYANMEKAIEYINK